MNDPDLYARTNDLARRFTTYFSDEFSYEISQMSGRCLDVGSGPGNTAVDLILPRLDKEASLICSDISEKMVNFAKEKYKDNERVSFLKLDIETPDLPKDLVGQFDHVLSFWCLNWCRDMRQVFENIFSLLRPGGSTFLLFVANSPEMNSYKILEAMPRYQPYIKHSLEPRKTLKALIKDVGFEVHHCSVREKSYTFVSPDNFTECVLSINPFIDLIPANLTEDYKKDLINEYSRLSIVFNKNGENEDEYSILTRYQLFIVYLKKPLTNNR